MKINQKKIIAREFLILLACIIISVITFFLIFPYNYLIDSKIEKIDLDISTVEDEIKLIQRPIEDKLTQQKSMFNEWQKNENLISYNDYREHWERLEYLHNQDSIQYKWKNRWNKVVIEHLNNLGFNNPNELDDYISKYSLDSNDLVQKEKSEELENHVLSLKKDSKQKEWDIFDSDDQLDFALLILLIVGIIAFPFRYLIYAIKWSLRTLKQDKPE